MKAGTAVGGVGVLTVLLVGCGASGSDEKVSAPASQSASTSPTASPAAKLLTASEVAKALAGAGLPVQVTKTYSAEDDPNHLLGRPNGYTSKVALADSRITDTVGLDPDALERGGSVEVYPDQAGAQARKDYIQTIAKSLPAATEYDYVKGGIIVRVTGHATPSQAADYEKALAAL